MIALIHVMICSLKTNKTHQKKKIKIEKKQKKKKKKKKKNELFDNFTVQNELMMSWLNLPQHIHVMAQLTPMSSIAKTNCLINCNI